MSDEQHPEIVDIGLPAPLPPLSTGILESICAGLVGTVHDMAVRGMAREILGLRDEVKLLREMIDNDRSIM